MNTSPQYEMSKIVDCFDEIYVCTDCADGNFSWMLSCMTYAFVLFQESLDKRDVVTNEL